jgi:hypothetical protein
MHQLRPACLQRVSVLRAGPGGASSAAGTGFGLSHHANTGKQVRSVARKVGCAARLLCGVSNKLHAMVEQGYAFGWCSRARLGAASSL